MKGFGVFLKGFGVFWGLRGLGWGYGGTAVTGSDRKWTLGVTGSDRKWTLGVTGVTGSSGMNWGGAALGLRGNWSHWEGLGVTGSGHWSDRKWSLGALGVTGSSESPQALPL